MLFMLSWSLRRRMYSRLLEVMGNVRRVDNSRDMKGEWLEENIRSWAKNFILSFRSLATNLLNKMRPGHGQKNYSTLNIQVHQYIGSQTDAGTKTRCVRCYVTYYASTHGCRCRIVCALIHDYPTLGKSNLPETDGISGAFHARRFAPYFCLIFDAGVPYLNSQSPS